jgi:hypothetical protein
MTGQQNQQQTQHPTCTGAAYAATSGACAAICLVPCANTQAGSGVARARGAAGASLRCAVDLVGSAQVCS